MARTRQIPLRVRRIMFDPNRTKELSDFGKRGAEAKKKRAACRALVAEAEKNRIRDEMQERDDEIHLYDCPLD